MTNNMLTIVTPTFERPDFLNRKLYHFSIQNCQNRIIIIDTSSEENLKKNEHTIKKYSKELNLDFQHLQQNHHFIEKIFMAVNQSQTPYTVISFDDDFLNLDNAFEGCRFLHENQDYSSTTGYTLNLTKPRIFTTSLPCVPILGKSDVYDDSDPLVRAQNFRKGSRNKNPLFNVWRTNILKVLLEPVAKAPWKKYSELLFDYAATISGKTKKINDIFEYRTVDYNKIEYRQKGLQGFTRGIEYDLLSSDFYKMISEITTIVIKYAQTQSDYDEEKIKQIFIQLYLGHRIKKQIKPLIKQTLCQRISKTKSFILIASVLRKIRHTNLLLNPSKLVMLIKLIKLYGYSKTGDLLRADPNFHFNHLSLTSSHSLYRKSYRLTLKALTKFPV